MCNHMCVYKKANFIKVMLKIAIKVHSSDVVDWSS